MLAQMLSLHNNECLLAVSNVHLGNISILCVLLDVEVGLLVAVCVRVFVSMIACDGVGFSVSVCIVVLDVPLVNQ